MVDKVLTYSARLHTQFCEIGFIATYKSQVMSSRDAFILVFAACRRARTVSACKTEGGWAHPGCPLTSSSVVF